MKCSHVCLALLALLIAGCSTSDEPSTSAEPLPPVPKVGAKVEAKVRACLNGIIDDLAAQSAEHPELVNFKPEFAKNGPHMLKARPNIIKPDGRESSFPPLGFTYSYNAVISRGKPPLFSADGCLIRIKFFGADPDIKVGNTEFYKGQGVRGTWYCAGKNADALTKALKEIIDKHAKALDE